MRGTFDVVVIGGGPAGATAALTLAQAGRNVLLIEKNVGQGFKVGESLPPAAAALLAELGLSERLLAGPHLPAFGNQSAWGSPVLHHTDFIRQPHGSGWHLDRSHFDAMLRSAAQDAGAQVSTGLWATEAVRLPNDSWQLMLDGHGERAQVLAHWLLDCSGRRSWLARQLGVKRMSDDRLLGFVSLFVPKSAFTPDLDSLTLIESTAEGWWYTVRLPSQQRVVVYLTDAGSEPSRIARSAQGFLKLLAQTEHIRDRIARYGYEMQGIPQATAANSTRLAQFSGAGWLAAGDAAAAYDPLSSYGILSALTCGIQAGRALDAHLSGDGEAIASYHQSLHLRYAAYLGQRTFYYSYERRWLDSLFWHSRLAVKAL